MAHQSRTKTILTTALDLAAGHGGEITADAISKTLDVRTRKEHKRLLNTLSELSLSGRLHRVRQGVYGPPLVQPLPDRRVVMWRILRMRRRVTVDDLVELAGVSASYALEWLRALVAREVVIKQQATGQKGTWLLINDTVDMPVDTEKAERLRALRRRQKAALQEDLEVIDAALSRVRKVVATIEEGE